MFRVLIIGYVWPEPRSSAAGSRMMQLIEVFLARNWQITFASAAQLSPHRADLTALGIAEMTVALNCDSFNSQVRELQPDLVLFDRFFTEEQFGWRVEAECPNAIRVLDTEDLHSLRHARELQLKQQLAAAPAGSAYYALPAATNASITDAVQWISHSDTGLRELAAIYRCDLTLMISPVEMELLQQGCGVPANLLHYCPFLLDEQPVADDTGFEQRQDFLSIGNFRHQPNWDAVLCLKNTLWPAIRAQLPKARLLVYGAYPPPKATALHNPREGFIVAGWVDDAAAAMRAARVCLAPLRFGAGLKGKLIEAMQNGTPSVTTPTGAEGMHGQLLWPGAIADNNADFVNQAVALYSDRSQWQQTRDRASVLLREVFPRPALTAALQQRLDDLLADINGHRQRNIVGSMLRHHLHKSHQYMSQWIAAKNRG
jgi:glycosyltransferase involved in cell wall biosynthesis